MGAAAKNQERWGDVPKPAGSTVGEQNAWVKFRKQVPMPFVTEDERVEDAFRAGFRACAALNDAKAERAANRRRR
jgi:hypothetical protein